MAWGPTEPQPRLVPADEERAIGGLDHRDDAGGKALPEREADTLVAPLDRSEARNRPMLL